MENSSRFHLKAKEIKLLDCSETVRCRGFLFVLFCCLFWCVWEGLIRRPDLYFLGYNSW